MPEKDRAALLAKEYNTTPRKGLSAEQWMRSRKHLLLFLAFIALVVAIAVVAVTAIVTPTKSTTLTTSPAVTGPALPLDLTGIQKTLEEINQNLARTGRPQISAAQMEAVKEVDRFIVGKDENALRQEFGFPEMKETNIQMMVTIVSHSKNGERFDSSPYFVGKDVYLRIDLAEGHIRHHGGSVVYDFPDAKRVYLLLQPAQYSRQMKELLNFETSSELPDSVINAIKDFHDAVSKNTDKLLTVMNDAIKKDLDYYLRYNDFSSPAYFHQIDKMWFDEFIQLRPKADKVRDSIRQFPRYRKASSDPAHKDPLEVVAFGSDYGISVGGWATQFFS